MAMAPPRIDVSDEEAMILDVVRKLVKEKVEPRAAQIDAESAYPADIKQLFAENDLLGIPFPAEYGGLGGTFLTYVKVVEEVAKACASSALIIAVQELGALPIMIFFPGTKKALINYINFHLSFLTQVPSTGISQTRRERVSKNPLNVYVVQTRQE